MRARPRPARGANSATVMTAAIKRRRAPARVRSRPGPTSPRGTVRPCPQRRAVRRRRAASRSPWADLAESVSASTGRTRPARRPAMYAATRLTSSDRHDRGDRRPDTGLDLEGARAAGPCPAWPSARRRTEPEARARCPTTAPSRVTVTVSRASSRRTCRGVAPMARRRAISRCRCCTNRVIMPASTRAATNSAMPPSEPLIAIRRMLASDGVEELGLAALVAGQHRRARRRGPSRRRRRRPPSRRRRRTVTASRSAWSGWP